MSGGPPNGGGDAAGTTGITLEELFREPQIVEDVRNLVVHWLRTRNIGVGGSVTVTHLSSELMARLWERIQRGENPNFENRRAAFGYLLRCARNLRCDMLRLRGRRPSVGALDAEVAEDPNRVRSEAEADRLLHFLTWRDADKSLRKIEEFDQAVERSGLSQQDAELLRGHFFFDLTPAQLAGDLGIERDEVERRLEAAWLALSDYLPRPAATTDARTAN